MQTNEVMTMLVVDVVATCLATCVTTLFIYFLFRRGTAAGLAENNRTSASAIQAALAEQRNYYETRLAEMNAHNQSELAKRDAQIETLQTLFRQQQAINPNG